MKHIDLENTKYIENKGDVLACCYTHKIIPDGENAIGSERLDTVDGKEWEVFYVHYETEDAYYGVPMLGLGLWNCRIEKKNTRLFTKEEVERYNGATIGLYGSHTGNFSGQSYGVNIEPIVSKWSNK